LYLMDSRSDEIFTSLKHRVKTVISLYEGQKSKASELQKENLELIKRIETLENNLALLDKKYENLKIAKVLSSVPGDDVHDTKLQVNRIVREIDKCIALLNR
jgi:DNA integrity scanning protein DisA with diadenylate cyclase activity